MGNRISESKLIQNYTVLFQNINKNDVIQNKLAHYGYDDTTIAQGQSIFDNLLTIYKNNQSEKAQLITTYSKFKTLLTNIKLIYTLDRKKARIIFKNEAHIYKSLSLNGKLAVQNAQLITNMNWFYKSLNNNPELLIPLQKLQINLSHVTIQLANLVELNNAYAAYMQEKGESQQATQNKNKAFKEMASWVSQLYSVAKIALSESPQLLESIAGFVRSN